MIPLCHSSQCQGTPEGFSRKIQVVHSLDCVFSCLVITLHHYVRISTATPLDMSGRTEKKQKQKNNFTVFPKKSDIHNSYVILKEQHEPMLFIDAWLLYPFVMGMFLLHIRICN